MDMAEEQGEEAEGEVEGTEMAAENDGTEEVVREDTAPAWTTIKEAVNNGTAPHPT